MREITGGTVAFGTFGSAHHYLLGGLIQDFARQAPGRPRSGSIGQNSAEVADAVRDGELEAGPDRAAGRRRGPRRARRPRARSCSTSRADPERVSEPITIETLADAPLILYDARWARRSTRPAASLRERAQQAGVTVEPVIEVEYLTAALDLAARGLGDTSARARVLTGARLPAQARHSADFDPPIVRDVRVHHPPQRPSLARHARVHEAGRAPRRGAGLRPDTINAWRTRR